LTGNSGDVFFAGIDVIQGTDFSEIPACTLWFDRDRLRKLYETSQELVQQTGESSTNKILKPIRLNVRAECESWIIDMRLLLVSPGYPKTFWSFDRVLTMLGKKCLLPPMGLLTIAALMPGNWQLKLVDESIRPVNENDWTDCDVLFVSGMMVQHSGILQTIREGRRRGKTVVVGGPWVFHFPQEALENGADIVVKGEGELAVSRLLEAIERRESGIVIETDKRPDLSMTPPPRYDLLELDKYVDLSIQFSRGCPFRCEFCDITYLFGRQVRTKSPSQILEELQVMYDLGWRRAVFFSDDNFIGNPAKAQALLDQLIPWMEERGHPFDFYTQASVNLASHTKLLDSMVKAGFYRVFLGIESTDVNALKLTKKDQNAALDLNWACEKINRAGLNIIAGCILGLDGEQPCAGQHLIDFAVRNQIPEIFLTLLQAGPGTDLYKRLEKEGRLLPTTYDDDFSSQTGLMNFVTSRPADEIVSEFVYLYDVLYEPDAYTERVFGHYSKMDPYLIKKSFSPPYLSEIRAVIITLFRRGVLSSARWRFWKYFFKGLVKFPGRFHHFLSACVVGEHYFDYRRTIMEQLQEGSAQREELSSLTAPEHLCRTPR
jgi:radical SAM superfamily enzyme YgiQ (UPF0313 family)